MHKFLYSSQTKAIPNRPLSISSVVCTLQHVFFHVNNVFAFFLLILEDVCKCLLFLFSSDYS